MKKSLLALLLGVSFVGNAAAESYDFSYIDGVDDYLGIQAAETYDVAICLPSDNFDGFKVKGFSAMVNSSGGVTAYSNPKLWLSSGLELTDNKFTPDIASYDVEISEAGMMTVALPEAYRISGQDLYLGYSVTVSKLNNATKFPMAFGDCSDSNSFFVRTSKSMPKWSNLAEEMQCGAAVTVMMETDNLAANSVSISSYPETIFMQIGRPTVKSFEFVSFAKEPVSSIDLEYSIDGKVCSDTYNMTTPVPAGLNKKFSVEVEIPAIDHKMREDVTFKVVKVNGQTNESKMQDATVLVGVLSEVPVHQTLVEEYTGTWCGWCPRGYAALEYMRANEPDFVVAAFHNRDIMSVTGTYPVAPSGFPFMSLDRYYGGDPYTGTGRYSGKIPVVEEIKAMNAEPTHWGIELSHSWQDDNTLVATANVWNVMGYEDEVYAVAYLLVADGLTGSSKDWAQSNYYYDQNKSDSYVPELNQFCRGGEYGKSSVSGLVFNDVVVSTNGIYGIAGSIPTSLEAEEKASHSLSFDLSEISEKLIPDRNKLRLIAAVLDKNGIVLNCTKNEVNDYVDSAVEGIFDENAPVEYYNLNGVKVSEPTQGVFIRRQGGNATKVIIR